MVATRAMRLGEGRIGIEIEDCVEAPNKRKKKNSRRIPGCSMDTGKLRKNSRIGRLAMLLQMPLDVFNEIAGHLSPGDLLNLARSMKSLREILMSRNSRPIWRSARNNVGLPDCPDDISEPKYADLLYGRGCMLCDGPRAKNVYFAFRLRLCKRCFKANTVNQIDCKREAMLHVPFEKLEELCNMAPVQYTEANQLTRWELFQEDKPMYFLDGFLKLVDDYVSLHADEKEAFIRTKKAHAAQINTHARLVEEWLEDQEAQRIEMKMIIGTERHDEIISRLRELGYDNGDLDIFCDRWYELIWEPKKLTERAWRRIKPELEEIIAANKQQTRLERLFQKYLDGEEMTSRELAMLIVEYFAWCRENEDVGEILLEIVN